ncbi:unnamed protein product [Lota lota]
MIMLGRYKRVAGNRKGFEGRAEKVRARVLVSGGERGRQHRERRNVVFTETSEKQGGAAVVLMFASPHMGGNLLEAMIYSRLSTRDLPGSQRG